MPDFLKRALAWFDALTWWQCVLFGLAIAVAAQWVIGRLVPWLTRRTETDIDDRVAAALRWPIFITVMLLVMGHIVRDMVGRETAAGWPRSLLLSIGVIVWMKAFGRISDAILESLARRADDFRWIEPRSLPLFEIAAKLAVVGGAIYALLWAWHVDPGAWLASAGILGIAVGFAAKDTLANLFAGVFILTDAPYQIGDYIIIDSGERGWSPTSGSAPHACSPGTTSRSPSPTG